MLTDTELLRKLDFFEPLDQKVIKRIATLCIAREFSAGDHIVRQGESGLGLYFITGGRAKVEIERDGAKVVVAELKEGDFLGEFSLIDDKARSANVICLQDTRCLLLTRDTFSKLTKKHPEIVNQMLKTLVSRIRSTNERISLPMGSAPPEPAPVSSAAPPEPARSRPTSGLAAATEQIASALPKPQDLFRIYSSSKSKTQEFFDGLFGAIYALKAMMRFSMAIVGCPVTVRAEKQSTEVLETALQGVKFVLFPAGNDQTIRIEGTADGTLTATVFRPRTSRKDRRVDVFRLEGRVRQNEVLLLHVPVDKRVRLEPSGEREDKGSLPAPSAGRRFPKRLPGKPPRPGKEGRHSRVLISSRRRRPANGQSVP